MSPRKVPKKGTAVFVPHDPTKGRVVPLMKDGKRIGSIRLDDVPPVRHIKTDDDYAGPPRGDAA